VHKTAHPVHVTLRAQSGVPSLRSPQAFAAVRRALSAASRSDFRLVHFSVQSDHVHMIVEAHDKPALTRGLRGLTIRTARATNRALQRHGSVWGDRYHARPMTTPREVRNGLVYVFGNFRKHGPADRRPVDPCSSAAWFDGFLETIPQPLDPPPTCRSRTWLGSTGWRKHGEISIWERPKPDTPRRRPDRRQIHPGATVFLNALPREPPEPPR
jgi:REP element-mobilizing transposase RayT